MPLRRDLQWLMVEISPYVSSILLSWMEDVGMNENSMCHHAVISTYANSGRYIVKDLNIAPIA